MISVRPKVAELAFKLYGRPLHPELFQIHCSRTVTRDDYTAKIDITSSGHVVTWRYAGLTLTEVAAGLQHPLPQKRRLMSYNLKGRRDDRVECRGGVSYDMKFCLEQVEPGVFWTYQQELSDDSIRKGLLHQFDSSGRMATGALSYINIETRKRQMFVQSFHTFPDDYAIVKIESRFLLP